MRLVRESKLTQIFLRSIDLVFDRIGWHLMPPKASTGVSWPHYVSALALLVSLVAAALRVLLLGATLNRVLCCTNRIILLDWSDPYHCNSLLHRGQWLDTMFQNWQPDG